LTGGPDGPVNEALVQGQPQVARSRIEQLVKIFGDRLYVELQRHGTENEQLAEPGLIDLAYELDLPLVATNEPYFAKLDDYAAHDALTSDYVWTFTTLAPSVTFTTPADGATGVPLNQQVIASFSEAMDPTTITMTTFTLTGPGASPVGGSVTFVANGSAAIFAPTAVLAAGSIYTATITTGATDMTAHPLVADYVWSFTAGATPAALDLLADMSEAYPSNRGAIMGLYSVFLGLVFMVIVYFLPRGVTGLVEDAWKALHRPIALARGITGPITDAWTFISQPISLPRGIAGAIEDGWARVTRRPPGRRP